MAAAKKHEREIQFLNIIDQILPHLYPFTTFKADARVLHS